jgi:hypothetical protein
VSRNLDTCFRYASACLYLLQPQALLKKIFKWPSRGRLRNPKCFVFGVHPREKAPEIKNKQVPERSNTMKTKLTRIFAIAALALVAATVSAIPASAQNVYKGSFTLTSDVRWGQASLPAGEYTFTLQSTALPARIVVRGANGSQFVVTSSTDAKSMDAPSNLQIVRRNGESRISQLYLADLHMVLNYQDRSKSKDKVLAMGPVTTEQVLVASAK